MDRSPGEPRPRQRPLRPGRQRLQQRQHQPPRHAGPAGGHRREPHHHPSDPVATQSPPGRASGPRRRILRGLGLGGDRQSGQADAHQPRPRLPAAGPPGRCRRHRRHGGAEARPGAVRGDQFRRQLPRVVRDRGDRQRRSHQGVSRQHRRRGAPGPGPVQAVLRRHRVRRLGLHGPQLRGPDPDPGEPGPGDRSEVPDPPRALRLGTPLPPRADLGDGGDRDLRRGLRAPLRLPHPDPGLRPARLVEQDPLEVGTAPRHIHRGAHPHREHPEPGPLPAARPERALPAHRLAHLQTEISLGRGQALPGPGELELLVGHLRLRRGRGPRLPPPGRTARRCSHPARAAISSSRSC